MSEDGKTMQERLHTILRESRLLAQDAGNRFASFARWAYRDVKRRFGGAYEPGEAAPGKPAEKPGRPAAGVTTPEGYSAGQVWQPRDPSKKARRILDIRTEDGEYVVVWQAPEGGQQNSIKEASFTRWVRRESARLK